jgi:SWI/SNF-related matrix-associated actin-dependent regulator of chromatin subfamily A-like protein 1
MSAVFFQHKRRRRIPTAVFSLKNEEEIIIKLKGTYEAIPFECIGRNQYKVPMDNIETSVQHCLDMGLLIDCIPEEVEKAMSYSPGHPFDDTFKKTEIYQKMFQYQKDGVEQVVRHLNGRALIADDMGLGKTLQAIALSKYYGYTKVLVICPAYLRFNWKAEFNKWLGIEEVCLIKKGKDKLEGYPVIISYELAVKKRDLLLEYGFDMVICDESHYMKNHKTKRTRGLSPLIRKIDKALLLTGTPALNRPSELFSQANMVRREFFPKFKQFAERYCDRKMSPLGYWDDTGSSNPHEVHWLAKKTVMIRRLKRDVLKDLPKKHRSQLHIEMDARDTFEMIPLFDEWKQLNAEIPKMQPCSKQVQAADFRRKCIISELFGLTAEAKCSAMQLLVKDTMQNGKQFLVFCYHKTLMNAIEEACDGKAMRIDGDTPTEKRHQYVKDFQEGKYQVAVLSMLAAGTGITLTAASHVIFAELYWVPGVLMQSEDRVHRIGQENPCHIQYVICKDTLDAYIYKSIQWKLDTIDGCLDQRTDRNFKGEDTIYNMI